MKRNFFFEKKKKFFEKMHSGKTPDSQTQGRVFVSLGWHREINTLAEPSSKKIIVVQNKSYLLFCLTHDYLQQIQTNMIITNWKLFTKDN
jgi:hypothetical protein